MAPPYTSTVLSLWLPIRENDEAAIDAGATPDIFRIRVPHTDSAPTQLQKDVMKLAELGCRELHLLINKKKPYKKDCDYLNTLSKAIGSMYNDWADEDNSEEDDPAESEGSDFSDDERDQKRPKKTVSDADRALYVMPVVTSLTKEEVLATHLNRVRPYGEPVRTKPYQTMDEHEHFVVVFVTHDSVNE
jgi:hypothetical protein